MEVVWSYLICVKSQGSINYLFRPPPTEDVPPEDSYLFFKTDSTDLIYTWDSPGDGRGVAIVCLSRDCSPSPFQVWYLLERHRPPSMLWRSH